MNRREIAEDAAITGASVGTMMLIQSLWLHRAESHGAIRFKRSARAAARFGTWLLSGMAPREYVKVHTHHHIVEDKPGDFHSPVQHGRFGVPKVIAGNPVYYRRGAKELAAQNFPDKIKPDKLDAKLYDRSLLGQAALLGIFTAAKGGDIKKGAKLLAIHDVSVLVLSGLVNGWLHRGQENVRALWNKPVPDADGRYTRNAGLVLGFLTMGDGNHDTHHRHPGQLRLHPNPFLDIGGVVGEQMIKLGLAEAGGPPQDVVSASTETGVISTE